MKRSYVVTAAVALATAMCQTPAAAQGEPMGHGGGHGGAPLHINTRWKECSIQLAPSLTQAAFRQFTQEAGLVVYFRPLSDARPMGRGTFEVSALQWKTGIDDAEAAWNDTFVHPDSTHWLFEGSGLQFPGLTVRAGVGEKTDVGVYVTKSPGANYGFYGGQLQRNLVETASWAAAARVSFVSMYGPEDVDFAVYGADFLASKTITLTRWAAVSPYAGVSTYVGRSHEKSAVVSLDDETTLGAQGMVGAAIQLSKARLGVDYNVGKVPTFSMKVGIGL